MRKIILIMIFLLGIALLSCGKPQKVLVQTTYRTNAGIEGDLSSFVEYKYGMDRVDEDIKEKISLTTDLSIKVENEFCTEMPNIELLLYDKVIKDMLIFKNTRQKKYLFVIYSYLINRFM